MTENLTLINGLTENSDDTTFRIDKNIVTDVTILQMKVTTMNPRLPKWLISITTNDAKSNKQIYFNSKEEAEKARDNLFS